MTNLQIHEMANTAYARFSGKSIGYSVRWETGEWKFSHPEHDVAGFMSKRDALHIAAMVAKAGYKGVRVHQTCKIDTPHSWQTEQTIILSEDSPELYQVAHGAVANELNTLKENKQVVDTVVAHQCAVQVHYVYADDAGIPPAVLKSYLERWLQAELVKQTA